VDQKTVGDFAGDFGHQFTDRGQVHLGAPYGFGPGLKKGDISVRR